MECPHCRVHIHDNPTYVYLSTDVDGGWFVSIVGCPACKKASVNLLNGPPQPQLGVGVILRNPTICHEFQAYPKGTARPPCPVEVPSEFAADFNESCLVLSDSPKASAALSRRCLQNILREVAKVKPADLYDEIEDVLQCKKVPTYVGEALHTVRVIGNFAAHPIKSKSSGEIVDVEPGEAEWNLEALEAVFDFYFVQPARSQARKDAINKKLQDAGKKPLT